MSRLAAGTKIRLTPEGMKTVGQYAVTPETVLTIGETDDPKRQEVLEEVGWYITAETFPVPQNDPFAFLVRESRIPLTFARNEFEVID